MDILKVNEKGISPVMGLPKILEKIPRHNIQIYCQFINIRGVVRRFDIDADGFQNFDSFYLL